ncbi:MAG TPA: ribonuclease, partial [Acetobacteraceae bacterium]|nr:ribonuclease [Acetobacteraceae bacterium]
MSAAGAIRVASSPGEARVAVVTGGGLADYAIWRPGAPDGVGDLHRGRVTARVPALAGAFVALAGVPDGFLPDSEGGAGVTVGDPVGVRITRAAQGGKGPRLSARL